jgi:hypothetical protein
MGGNRPGEDERFTAAIVINLTFARPLSGCSSLRFGAEAVVGQTPAWSAVAGCGHFDDSAPSF